MLNVIHLIMNHLQLWHLRLQLTHMLVDLLSSVYMLVNYKVVLMYFVQTLKERKKKKELDVFYKCMPTKEKKFLKFTVVKLLLLLV